MKQVNRIPNRQWWKELQQKTTFTLYYYVHHLSPVMKLRRRDKCDADFPRSSCRDTPLSLSYQLKYRGDDVDISSLATEVETVNHIVIIIDRWIMDFLRRGKGRGLGGFPWKGRGWLSSRLRYRCKSRSHLRLHANTQTKIYFSFNLNPQCPSFPTRSQTRIELELELSSNPNSMIRDSRIWYTLFLVNFDSCYQH